MTLHDRVIIVPSPVLLPLPWMRCPALLRSPPPVPNLSRHSLPLRTGAPRRSACSGRGCTPGAASTSSRHLSACASFSSSLNLDGADPPPAIFFCPRERSSDHPVEQLLSFPRIQHGDLSATQETLSRCSSRLSGRSTDGESH